MYVSISVLQYSVRLTTRSNNRASGDTIDDVKAKIQDKDRGHSAILSLATRLDGSRLSQFMQKRICIMLHFYSRLACFVLDFLRLVEW